MRPASAPELASPHGGRLREAARRYGIALDQWLDLSTGLNPVAWPVPPLPLSCWQRLPEDDDGLEIAAAQYYGSDMLLPVAGSQAALQALPWLRPHGAVGVVQPAYAEHAAAWMRAGHHVEDVEPDAIDSLLPALDALVLVNPNNPTAERYPIARLLAWHRQLAARGGWLVVDEAFIDATPAESLVAHAGLRGLIVLRSLGKFFGLAGARVGFVFADAALRGRLAHLLGPWAVSGPARAVAMLALGDHSWQANQRQRLPQQSESLRALLSRHGLPPAGCNALFQWVRSEHAAEIAHTLAHQGVLVRRFDFPESLRFGLPADAAGFARLDLALGRAMAALSLA